MKIGLFFGSFNPIHNGHLIIANKMYEAAGFDEVWFIPSPQNPFKEQKDLLPFIYRYEMIQNVIESQPHLKVDPIEDSLDIPSYTITTLEALHRLYPKNEFHIIMGTDILIDFHLWKEYEKILKTTQLHVYNRTIDEDIKKSKSDKIHYYSLPLLDISSTSIRASIHSGKSVIGELDSKVWQIIKKQKWYF
ncbi:MAG: nicotinate (nicotinamide) nucleotide adenylyltransferase [Chitinophagales bacterium]|nr:nicotinate (nicotinamide) nucleotide adenylyltransferase [Chitinophagales bacterium]